MPWLFCEKKSRKRLSIVQNAVHGVLAGIFNELGQNSLNSLEAFWLINHFCLLQNPSYVSALQGLNFRYFHSKHRLLSIKQREMVFEDRPSLLGHNGLDATTGYRSPAIV